MRRHIDEMRHAGGFRGAYNNLVVGAHRHPLRLDADRNFRNDPPLRDIEHGNLAVVLIGDIKRFAVMAQRQKFRIWIARQNPCNREARQIQDLDMIGIRGADKQALAIARQHDAAWPRPNRNSFQNGKTRPIQNGDRIVLLVGYKNAERKRGRRIKRTQQQGRNKSSLLLSFKKEGFFFF
jgi:hypothetical protein